MDNARGVVEELGQVGGRWGRAVFQREMGRREDGRGRDRDRGRGATSYGEGGGEG